MRFIGRALRRCPPTKSLRRQGRTYGISLATRLRSGVSPNPKSIATSLELVSKPLAPGTVALVFSMKNVQTSSSRERKSHRSLSPCSTSSWIWPDGCGNEASDSRGRELTVICVFLGISPRSDPTARSRRSIASPRSMAFRLVPRPNARICLKVPPDSGIRQWG